MQCLTLPRRWIVLLFRVKWSNKGLSLSPVEEGRQNPYLEPAEGVLLGEVHWGDVVVEEALACAPEGLQLVPLGQDGIAFITQQGGCRQGTGCVYELIGLCRSLGLLPKKASCYTQTHTHGKNEACCLLKSYFLIFFPFPRSRPRPVSSVIVFITHIFLWGASLDKIRMK